MLTDFHHRHRTSPLVCDVSGVVFCRVKCLSRAQQMMENAIEDGNASRIKMMQRLHILSVLCIIVACLVLCKHAL